MGTTTSIRRIVNSGTMTLGNYFIFPLHLQPFAWIGANESLNVSSVTVDPNEPDDPTSATETPTEMKAFFKWLKIKMNVLIKFPALTRFRVSIVEPKGDMSHGSIGATLRPGIDDQWNREFWNVLFDDVWANDHQIPTNATTMTGTIGADSVNVTQAATQQQRIGKQYNFYFPIHRVYRSSDTDSPPTGADWHDNTWQNHAYLMFQSDVISTGSAPVVQMDVDYSYIQS